MENHARELDAVQRLELRSRLLTLPFAGFARCLADLMTATGYQDVNMAGRTQWKGRNQGGGYDLEGSWETALSRRKVVVQVKQFGPHQRVYQRTIDELRGVALRAGAQEAVLLTTGPLSAAIREEASSNLPVRAVEGSDLLDLLMFRGIGVTGMSGKAVVDHAYFDRLTARHETFAKGERSHAGKAAGRPKAMQNDKAAQNIAPVSASEGQPHLVMLTLSLPVTLSRRIRSQSSQ